MKKVLTSSTRASTTRSSSSTPTFPLSTSPLVHLTTPRSFDQGNIDFIPLDIIRAILLTLPAFIAVVFFQQIALGSALAVGIIPLGIMPLPARIQGLTRHLILSLGLCLFLILGSALSFNEVAIMAGLFFLGLLATWLLNRTQPRLFLLGTFTLTAFLPALAAGTSFTFPQAGLILALIIFSGSIWSLIINALWIHLIHPAYVLPKLPVEIKNELSFYGFFLGTATALSSLLAYLLHFTHVGWAAITTALVMRPNLSTVEIRSAGRLITTFLGVGFALLLFLWQPSSWIYGLSLLLVLMIAITTRSSRWYLASGCTAFLILTMLTTNLNFASAQEFFTARLVETLIGVGIALLFTFISVLLTKNLKRTTRRRH